MTSSSPAKERNFTPVTTMSEIKLPNENLSKLESDRAFHLDISLDQDTTKTYADVKFVCIGGTPSRMRAACITFAKEIYGRTVTEDNQLDLVFKNDRYSGFKVGAILCVNHGMGLPSVSIMLHELFKLLSCAGCRDVTIIRIGTSGGVGVPPGTVVISEESLTAGLKPLYHTSSFGNTLSLPVKADCDVINDLKSVNHEPGFDVISAKTYCTDDFYQDPMLYPQGVLWPAPCPAVLNTELKNFGSGQGRLDGSFCDSTESDKHDFLTRLFNLGVRNIEMESAGVLALTHKVGIKAAVVCVTLLDRFKSDLVSASSEQMKEWEDRPIQLVTKFMKSKLQD